MARKSLLFGVNRDIRACDFCARTRLASCSFSGISHRSATRGTDRRTAMLRSHRRRTKRPHAARSFNLSGGLDEHICTIAADLSLARARTRAVEAQSDSHYRHSLGDQACHGPCLHS
jgi:hypothetical protein